MGSSSKLVIGLAAAVVVLLLAVVGLVAYMAGQRSTSDGEVAAVQAVETPAVPPADAAADDVAPVDAGPAGDGPPSEQTGLPSVDPFPQTLDELRSNPRALAAAEAIVAGSQGAVSLDNYGSDDVSGWRVQFKQESYPYLLLSSCDGSSADEFVEQYVTLLRQSGDGFEYITVGQPAPAVSDIRAAGITPAEYEETLLPMLGEWPCNDSGEVRSW